MTEIAAAPAPTTTARRALAGARVVELGFAAAGPLVGKYLANQGAEVIHIESRTAPDMFRTAYPPFKDNVPGLDRAGMFAFYNDGKRSVTLNLKHPRAVELARALILASDVLIESFPAGTLARRGLAPDSLRAASPRLIVLSSCNQGQTGPQAQHPGYGSQLTAHAGFAHLLGEPDSTPLILYGPYIDYIAVGYGVIAVLAALARRGRTGEGCTIDLSQYEAGLQFMTPALLDFRANGRVPTRDGNRDRVAAPHGVYPCRARNASERDAALPSRASSASPERVSARSDEIDRNASERDAALPSRASSTSPERVSARSDEIDRNEGERDAASPSRASSASPERVSARSDEIEQDTWVALSVWGDDEWRQLAVAVGDPAWARDPRFATAEGRRHDEAELDRRITEWTQGRSRDEAVAALRSRGLRAAPVSTIGELFTDPQLSHRGFWRSLPHPVIGMVRCMAAPFRLSFTSAVHERAGPLLGADNGYVFGEVLGLAPEELARLAADGVFE